MKAYLEVWEGGHSRLVLLEGERISVGKDESNDVALTWDKTVSRLHATLERLSSGWSVRDLGSRNGTSVNGQLITGERALRPGDELLLGETRLLFRVQGHSAKGETTVGTQKPPEITRREREVLAALCRPVLRGTFVSEPASLREIAKELVVSESAVKKHLSALYDKFGFIGQAERRRGRLAGEAIRRGVLTLADLRKEDG